MQFSDKLMLQPSLYLHVSFVFSQRFARQLLEDQIHAAGEWHPDLPIPETLPSEDPDDEDHLSIPLARASAPGKPRAPVPINEWSDDDEDECRIIDVIDATPLNFAPPAPSTTATSSKRAETRKRAGTGMSDTGGDEAGAKRAKTGKKPGTKPPKKKKGPPTSTG